ncbi:hypothetical protein KUCAC02_014633, partial [Chaenocephalus aceratus]
CLTGKQWCGLALQCASNSNKQKLTRRKAQSNCKYYVKSKAQRGARLHTWERPQSLLLAAQQRSSSNWSLEPS